MGTTARIDKATRLRQKPSYRWRFPDRALHVVDIQNLAGAPILSRVQVNEVQDRYTARLGSARPIRRCTRRHLGFINVALGWPHARYRVRSGPDGADLELLDVLEHEDVAARFSHVVIGSGDWRGSAGRLASLARGGASGSPGRAGRGSLAAVLARAAQDVVYLDFPAPRPPRGLEPRREGGDGKPRRPLRVHLGGGPTRARPAIRIR